MKQIGAVWKEIGNIVSRRPTVIVPFFITALIQTTALYILYLAPQRPVTFLLGPPIKVFFGNQYLHYPLNFVLLPRIFNYAEIAINGILGMLMTAIGVGMISDTKGGERASFLINGLHALKRYFALFAIWLLTFGIVTGISKVLTLVLRPTFGALGFAILIFYFLLTVILNLLFVYSIFLIIIKKKSLITAIREGILTLGRLFVPTLLLVIIPTLLYLPIVILKSKTVFLINNVFPESVLVVLYSGIALGALIEFIAYASLAILYINKEGR